VFVADTNILLYAAERTFPEHARCRELVEGWRRRVTAWYTTWGILYEFLRVATHPRVFRRPWPLADAWRFLEVLLDSPGLGILTPTERHRAVASRLFEEVPAVAGNLVHDAHTVILMKEHGIRTIYTRDTDFHRFPGVEVRDPLC
jgi:toxin-antitoxin system PIN domain toxin